MNRVNLNTIASLLSSVQQDLKGEELSLGSRVMAVADVFTAVAEDRPYRKGMPSDRVLQLLQDMAAAGALDPQVVSVLRQHFEEINAARIAAQRAASASYSQLQEAAGGTTL